MDESQQWVEFGRWLAEQREQRGLRRRDAARRAKVSETLWRDLETGRKEAIGAIRLLPNPSADVLERVAGALELPVEDVLARIGRPTRPARASAASTSGAARSDDDGSLLAVKLRRLSERDRALVERAGRRHARARTRSPRLGAPVRFGIFYEFQLPRPWGQDDEHRLLKEALEQVELADRLGFDYVWEVEHHFLEEYSHSSAPEVFLAAASQRTSRIRLGHGIVQLPVGFNHPARVAERIATLDLVSDGRVEFGTGESSSEAELGGYGVERATKRDQWREALDVVTRLMVEEPFAGYDGRFVHMPPRNMVPKPLQRPHPPLWVACSRRDTIHLAATLGIGALTFSFVEADEAKAWVDDYYATIASEDCVPAGFAVNPNLACVLPLMCHADEATAIDRGLDGSHFFGYSLGHYYVFGMHKPGRDRRVAGVPGEPGPLRVQPRRGGPDRPATGRPAHGARPRVVARCGGDPVADHGRSCASTRTPASTS